MAYSRKQPLFDLGRLFCFFFFSSRRRHTILSFDWSSDVCSSDLRCGCSACRASTPTTGTRSSPRAARSEERREGKRVDLGGRRIIKKKKPHVAKNHTATAPPAAEARIPRLGPDPL